MEVLRPMQGGDFLLEYLGQHTSISYSHGTDCCMLDHIVFEKH